jgi:hypothetical protein
MIGRLKFLPAILILSAMFYPGAHALTVEEIHRLKHAGLSDETIQVIIREKAVETAAFTADEIVALKRSGIGDKTLQAIITEGSFMKNSQARIYGRTTRTLDRVSPDDLIRLKQAGFNDDVIQAVIECNSERTDDIQRQQAYEFLKNMGVLVDLRKGFLPRPGH